MSRPVRKSQRPVFSCCGSYLLWNSKFTMQFCSNKSIKKFIIYRNLPVDSQPPGSAVTDTENPGEWSTTTEHSGTDPSTRQCCAASTNTAENCSDRNYFTGE